MAVKVRLKDGSSNVLHPETDWSVVLNGPSIKLRYSDGSHDTTGSSRLDALSKAFGQDSEAWDTYSNGDKSILIGNKYNALGFYGSNSRQDYTALRSNNDVYIETLKEVGLIGKNIRVTTNDTNNNGILLADYPINWTALNNRPFNEILSLKNLDGSSTAQSSVENAVFGTYYVVNPSSNPDGIPTITYYPAFAIVSQKLVGGVLRAERLKGYFLSANGTLEEITDMGHFSGLLDSRKKNQ